MKKNIVDMIRFAVFISAASIGGHSVLAQDAADSKKTEARSLQIQNMMKGGAPEQAATIQMGISPEQLNSLMGPREPEQKPKKFVYKPKDATEVEHPPRLFNNIPKWH